MSEKRNQVIRDFCEGDYSYWLYSRSKYQKGLPWNILARFQPSKVPTDKDYPNSQLCAAFHIALMAAIGRDVNKAKCFLYVFFPKAKPAPVKTLAYELHINIDTANEWAHRTAETIYRIAQSQVEMFEMMRD